VILHAFITYQAHLEETLQRVSSMMSALHQPYIVACGGFEAETFDPDLKVLRLACDDSYPGLPQKITHLCRAFSSRKEFSVFSHLAKVDEDIAVLGPIPPNFLVDYGGATYRRSGNRSYHFGKCPGSPWNWRPYEGVFVPWNLGGYGYILSRNAAALIGENQIAIEEIYEDLMVAKILEKNGIFPTYLPVLRVWNSVHKNP
jgi:hypothetical protein